MYSLTNLLQAVSRVHRHGRSAVERITRRGRSRPPFKRSMLFEAIEQRVLMSADFTLVAPLGSMVNVSSQAGQFAAPDSDISYTLSLDAGLPAAAAN